MGRVGVEEWPLSQPPVDSGPLGLQRQRRRRAGGPRLLAGTNGEPAPHLRRSSGSTSQRIIIAASTFNSIVASAHNAYDVRRPISFSSHRPHGGGPRLQPAGQRQYTCGGIAPFIETGAHSLDLRVNQENPNRIILDVSRRIAYT